MSVATDSGYGASFAHFYERLSPAGEGAQAAIEYRPDRDRAL